MGVRRRTVLAAAGTAALAGCLDSNRRASLGAIGVLNRDWRAYDVEVVLGREDFMDGNYVTGAGEVRVPGATYEDGELLAAALVPLGSDWPDDVTAVGLRTASGVEYAPLDLGDVDPDCADLVFGIDPGDGRATPGPDAGTDDPGAEIDLDVVPCGSGPDFLGDDG